MHPLRRYLNRNKLTQEAFAEQFRRVTGEAVSQQFVSEIMSGKRHPSREYARLFERATEGKVKAAKLLLFEPRRPVTADAPTTTAA